MEEGITQLGRAVAAGFGVIATTRPENAYELGAGYIVNGAVEHDATHMCESRPG